MSPRIMLLAAIGAALSVSALASPRDDALDAMLKCASMTDADARHACFDAAIPQLKAASQTAPVGEQPTEQQIAAAQQERETHQEGSEGGSWLSGLNPFSGSDKPPSQQQMAYQAIGAEILPLTIGVADFTTGMNGYTVTLDNGQVWQNYPRLVDAPPFSASEKNVVTIDRALLGGYNMTLQGRGRGKLFKVVRVE